MSEHPEISSDEVSKIVKKYAEKQKIDFKLTVEQLQAILLKGKDPKMPIKVSFYVGSREVGNTIVAAIGMQATRAVYKFHYITQNGIIQ